MDIPGGFFCLRVAERCYGRPFVHWSHERCYGRTFAHRSHERIFREALLFFAFPDLLTMVCCIAGSGLMKNDADVISALTKRKRVPHLYYVTPS
jgi:hypothetical protein